MTKSQLRSELRLRLRHCNQFPEQEPLRSQLRQQLARYNPDVVLAFVPGSDEVNIWPVLQELPCLLAFAKVAGRELEFALWRGFGPLPDLTALDDSALWQRHPHMRLLEPKFPIVPDLSTFERIVLLCPGLGFFQQNSQILRLGRGGGFYDRAIARLRGGEQQAWGLAYSVQWHSGLATVHEPRYDQVLDGLYIAGRFIQRSKN